MIFAGRLLTDSPAQLPGRSGGMNTDRLVVLKSPEFRAQGTANAMQAPSCLRVDGGLAFAAPGAAAKAEELSPQNLANAVWRAGKVSSENPDFVASLFASVEARREESHAQHPVSTAWTPATFRHMKEAMMKMTGERLVAGVLEPQDLSNAVRDLAKAAFLHFPLMAAASSGAKSRLVEFSEQNLTNSA
ncbi:unnamed protein product [Symbiodinium sp. CCMP2592]|nr:unnamed protein product [Symbiodinium sp. CCMP2592]